MPHSSATHSSDTENAMAGHHGEDSSWEAPTDSQVRQENSSIQIINLICSVRERFNPISICRMNYQKTI